MAIARSERQPSEAREIIRDPMVLEFLGLKRESAYYEKDIEQAIITHLQDFLLELGNGFSFIARQKTHPPGRRRVSLQISCFIIA